MSTAPPVPPPPGQSPPGPPADGPPPPGPPPLPPIQPPGPRRKSNAAVWWTLGICLTVILALLAGAIAIVGWLVTSTPDNRPRYDPFPRMNSDEGTHLEAREGDLKIGHNRAVNACNLMTAGLTAEFFGKPPEDRARVSESYVDSDIAPTMLPSYGSPLYAVTTCSRPVAEDHGNYGSDVRLSVSAYANEEASTRGFNRTADSRERSAKNHPNSQKFTRISETMYAEQRTSSSSSQRTEITMLASSYTLLLSVTSVASERAGRPAESASAQLERAKPLAEQVQARVRDARVDSHPAELPKLGGKAQVDPCAVFTAHGFQNSLLKARTGTAADFTVASPIVGERGYPTSAPAQGDYRPDPSRTCRRASGLRHYSWPDATPSAGTDSRSSGSAREDAGLTITRYDSAERARALVTNTVEHRSADERPYSTLPGLGDAAAIQRTTRSSSQTTTIVVAHGASLLRFTDSFRGSSRDSPSPELPDKAYTDLLGPALKQLS